MKENPEKCHLLMNANRLATIKIGEHIVSNSYCKKLLGVNSILTITLKLLLKSQPEGTCFG